MNKLILALLVGFVFTSYADQYDDLKAYAKVVPHAEVDKEALEYISNETNESPDGMQSNYTLALFEDTQSGRSWYILDGYYVLKSGKILFLDFLYRPETKTWWPIENYKYRLPGSTERFMLEAEEVCNPYKRHFIGMVTASLDSAGLDRVQKFFAEQFKSQPIFLLNESELTIIDPTKSARGSDRVLFALSEQDLVAKLGQTTGLSASIVPSGRAGPNEGAKKTYVGSSGNCLK